MGIWCVSKSDFKLARFFWHFQEFKVNCAFMPTRSSVASLVWSAVPNVPLLVVHWLVLHLRLLRIACPCRVIDCFLHFVCDVHLWDGLPSRAPGPQAALKCEMRMPTALPETEKRAENRWSQRKKTPHMLIIPFHVYLENSSGKLDQKVEISNGKNTPMSQKT